MHRHHVTTDDHEQSVDGGQSGRKVSNVVINMKRMGVKGEEEEEEDDGWSVRNKGRVMEGKGKWKVIEGNRR